jgi:hypothetical protein
MVFFLLLPLLDQVGQLGCARLEIKSDVGMDLLVLVILIEAFSLLVVAVL